MSATVSTPTQRKWLATLCSGRPHQIISTAATAGPGGETVTVPYLHRWFLLPRNRWVNLYLHRFVGSDDPVGLHNHPWWFASLVLHGAYTEVSAQGSTVRRRGTVALRGAAHRHRIALMRDHDGHQIPCWTVILTGPQVREWGFWCPSAAGEERFVPWEDFGDGGCGETTPAWSSTHNGSPQ